MVVVTWLGCGAEERATGQAFDPEQMGTTSNDAEAESSSPMQPSTSGDPRTSTSTASSESTSPGGESSVGEATEDSGGSESTGTASDCPRVRVSVGPGLTLNVRPDPSTTNAPVGSLAEGAVVEVVDDEVFGESVEGVDLWYEIGGAVPGFVHSAFASCTSEPPPDIDPDGWYLPLPCGVSAEVTQGNDGALSHNGTSAFAFDFGLPPGSPLVAMAQGVVTQAYGGTMPGDPCYDGGGMGCSDAANYVTLQHADGTKSVYLHLQSPSVGIGDSVGVGEPVGLSGSSGWSTGRHAHVMRMEGCGGYYCQSVALAFDDVSGDGVPVTGQVVTSANCP